MKLISLNRCSTSSSSHFQANYLSSNTPVILETLMDDWSAKSKWSLQYFKEQYGDLQVPVFDQTFSKSGKKYMQASQTMPFRDYLSAIQAGPSNWRLFLFNLFEHVPALKDDFKVPTIMDGFIKEYPFTFFGGANSKVALHYDIDKSHVFLSQFEGRKRVVLFAPNQSRNLYQLPFTVSSHVDINKPDYQKYPALANVQGYEALLYPGDTLFIPSGYWHYIEYLDAGFSMSQRASDSIITKMEGVVNIAKHFVIDRGMNHLCGEKWATMKATMAQKRAQTLLTEVSVY